MGPEYPDVDVKHNCGKKCYNRRQFFELFSVKGKGEHLSSRKQVAMGCLSKTGNRKTRKLGRKAKDLKRKISVSGVPLKKCDAEHTEISGGK